VRYRVTGEAFQRFSVAVEEPLGAAGEVLVLADPFDLGFEGVDDESVDAGAFDPGDGFGAVGEVFGEPNGGLLSHGVLISRYRDNAAS